LSDIPRTGQLLLILDPARGGNGAFAGRVAEFLEHLRTSGLDRLPADRRYRHRDAAMADGIPDGRDPRAFPLILRTSAACRPLMTSQDSAPTQRKRCGRRLSKQ
jgi:hypothetical protein